MNGDRNIPTAYLGRSASEYDALRFTTEGGSAIHETELDLFRQALREVPAGSRVLEVGCGTGRFLLAACDAGMRSEGLDASPDMITQSKARILPRHPQTPFHVSEAARLPFPDGHFDFVYSIRLLNQTESTDYALRTVDEMLRVTKPGGYALIEFMNLQRPGAKRDVRLAAADVLHAVARRGEAVWLRGAFLLGMTAQHRSPRWLLPLVQRIDRAGSRLLPRLCSRCYILARRG